MLLLQPNQLTTIMQGNKYRYIILLCYFFIQSSGSALSQDSTRFEKIISSPNKLFTSLDKKTKSIKDKLSKQTGKYLTRLQRQEKRLQKRVWKKDSLLAKQLFTDLDGKINSLRVSQSTTKYDNVYSGRLDSLTTALNFLKNSNLGENVNNETLKKSLEQFADLQEQLNQTEKIKEYLAQRQKLLNENFQKLGMVRQLKNYKKQIYYYSAQVKEYKALIESPSKLEAKLMQSIAKLPAFKEFFARNSQLGSLFALPDGNAAAMPALQGLGDKGLLIK